MKTIKTIATLSIASIVLAGSFAAPAYAWRPEIKVTKYVQNQTIGGEMKDANDAASAVATKPGDTIKYTIVVENPASPASNGHNDLHFTKLTDTLPAGVELVSDSSKREITENLGVLKPGQKITKEYILKVNSNKNGDVVLNEACATGDSEVKDAPRKDCDIAVIKVNVPEPPKTPQPPKETPKVLSTELPHTGPAGILSFAGAATVLGYLGNLIRIKRRSDR
jgi:uncharacterized repeat protein (TIGR01451 family)